jgi:hypothetical protein
VKARATTDAPKKARRVANPYTSTLACELAERAQARQRTARAVNLKQELARAAAAEDTERTGGEASKAPGSAEKERRFRRVTERRVITDVNLEGDFEHAAERGQVQGSERNGQGPEAHGTLADYRAAKKS